MAIELLNKTEIDALAHDLAYAHCVSVIEGGCVEVTEEPGETDLYDLTSGEYMAEEIKYLEARGLLEHHDGNPNWAWIRDESEGLPL
jgi:hypothetical protein